MLNSPTSIALSCGILHEFYENSHRNSVIALLNKKPLQARRNYNEYCSANGRNLKMPSTILPPNNAACNRFCICMKYRH